MKAAVVILLILAVVSAGGFFFLRSRQTASSQDGTSITRTQTPAGVAQPGDASISVAREIVVEASEYKFTPAEITVKKGETVKITLKNTGRMQHDWMVENMGGASIDTTSSGQTSSITITPSQKGTFTTFCSIGNHRQLGMVGKLVVE